MDTELTSEDHSQYLTFNMMDEEFAINIERIREIIEYNTVTRIPKTPHFVLGVINLRGHVVPVVDLAAKFGHAGCQITRDTCIVIVELRLEGEEIVIGTMADAVNQVIELRSEEIEPPPSLGTKIRSEFLSGLGRSGEKFMLILDIDQILSLDELTTISEVPEHVDLSELAASDDRNGEGVDDAWDDEKAGATVELEADYSEEQDDADSASDGEPGGASEDSTDEE